MKCPHCQVAFHDQPWTVAIGQDVGGVWAVIRNNCPECNRIVIELVRAGNTISGQGALYSDLRERLLVYPRRGSGPPPPQEVTADLAEDYGESALVIGDSPNASAALSRRCLQHLLREKAGVRHSNLATEIQEVVDSGKLPSHLSEAIDAVRNIGNFAAHPIKSTASGEVVAVEPGKAEWNLDVLDGLFDFFFVQPAILQKRRDALNAKLASAGKPPVK